LKQKIFGVEDIGGRNIGSLGYRRIALVDESFVLGQ
jgi:hypothetical protein